MLLALLAAVMLAVLLQLNARRSSRSEGYVVAADEVIHLRAWVVIEVPVRLAAHPILALPAPARVQAPKPRPLTFVGEMRMLRPGAMRRPPVRIPPDAIIIPDDILPALMAAQEIRAGIWRSPPGWRHAVKSPTATLH